MKYLHIYLLSFFSLIAATHGVLNAEEAGAKADTAAVSKSADAAAPACGFCKKEAGDRCTISKPAYTAPFLCEDCFKQPAFTVPYGKRSSFLWENMLRNEAFFSHNLRMLNDDNGTYDNTAIPGKYLLDSKITHTLKNELCDRTMIKTRAAVRFKGVYGDPEASFQTGLSTIKDGNVVLGEHKHPINVNVLVLREISIEFTLNDFFHLPYKNEHTFTAGLFPFKLGRGIALGDAYAITPDFIGYDPLASVEQYAPGFKLSGACGEKGNLLYDLYVEIVENNADSFNNVNELIRGSIYGYRTTQERGFGMINYIIAGRLKYTAFDEATRKLTFEPYGLMDDEREQSITFPSDASSRLKTFGCAMESAFGNFEFGFDMAFNTGTQWVYGVDTNILKKEIRAGVEYVVNTKVKDYTDPDNVVSAVYSTANQRLINAQIESASCDSTLEPLNGQFIKDPVTFETSELKNAVDRFYDAYTNAYQGSMCVFDALYRIPSCRLSFAFGGGFASGDDNPNKDLDPEGDYTPDGTYQGFVGLQEIYFGTRIKSAILMGGGKGVPRLLSFPASQDIEGGVPSRITRFNNLVFLGTSAVWEPELWCTKLRIQPNYLAYWQEHASRIFKEATETFDNDVLARTFLGHEINLFLEAKTAPGLTFWTTLAILVPGTHYEDVAGLPLSKAEYQYLNQFNDTGEEDPDDDPRIGQRVTWTPILGNDSAWFIDCGFDYRF